MAKNLPPVPISTTSGVKRKRSMSASRPATLTPSAMIREHLPAAKGMTAEQVCQARIPVGGCSVRRRPQNWIRELATPRTARAAVARP